MLNLLTQYGSVVGNPLHPLTVLGPREIKGKEEIKKRVKRGKPPVYYHYPAASVLMAARNFLKHRPRSLLGMMNINDENLRLAIQDYYYNCDFYLPYLIQHFRRCIYRLMSADDRYLLKQLILALRSLCLHGTRWDIERLNRMADVFAPVLFRQVGQKVPTKHQANLTTMYLTKFLIINFNLIM